ncbi:unnamed protein product [Rhizophagus irregularis]|nr:unnamed protein product [Rhizophagus irregularis]
MDGDAARDQKVASAKKTLKKFKKKKAASSVDSTTSDSGSVRTDGTGQETIAVAEEDNISATNTNPDLVENQASQDYSDYVPQSPQLRANHWVEGLQPIFQPHGQQITT